MSTIKEQVVKIVDVDSTNIGASVSQRGTKGAQSVEIVDSSGNQVSIDSGFGIPAYDSIELSYTGSDLTGVVYKISGATVATLTLTYVAGILQTITKT